MIDRSHPLPITKQAKGLGISRGSVYYLPRPVPAADLAIMRRMDELHLEFPFAGSRMLRDLLKQEGIGIGRRHVSTLMKRMGLEALYRKPSTSKPTPGHKIYPYLLRGMTIDRPNQVWAMDITDVPMARGFVYLAAVVDWFSRRVLSWRVSISLEAAFCVEALEEALARHGRPEVFNTDQGSQFTSHAFTSHAFTSVLLKAGINVNEPIETARRVAGGKGPRAGTTPLILAAVNAHYELAAYLLEAGADPNAIGPGYTALHTVTWVRKSGVGDNDPAPEGSGSMTSLQFVKKLVEHGADINARMTKKVNVGLTSLNTIGDDTVLRSS